MVIEEATISEHINPAVELGLLLAAVLKPEDAEIVRLLLRQPGIPVEFLLKTGHTRVT